MYYTNSVERKLCLYELEMIDVYYANNAGITGFVFLYE